ncbi:MAG: AraC family transcriptional regulator ligand-binding domain-containing protein [Actinomycetota bacterium]
MGNRYALEPSTRALLADMGLSPTAVMRRAGLRSDLLSGGPVWLSQDEFFSLWRALEIEANHPNLPLLIGQTVSPEVFAPPLFAAMMSPDLNTAAKRIAVYKRLIGPLRVEVDIATDQTTISFEWPEGADPPMSLVLTELLFWVELARLGTRVRVEPIRLTAFEAPVDAEAYRDVLGVEIEQAAASSVTLAAADAKRPFLTANESIWDWFEPQLRRRLRDVEFDAAPSERVRAVLLELLPVGRTTVAEAAAELAVSPRTLHRQLKAEGVSFQHILNTTREQLARHYLRDPALSAPDIAFLLGYGETSSFYRAFQNWTGETPEQVRSAVVDSRSPVSAKAPLPDGFR